MHRRFPFILALFALSLLASHCLTSGTENVDLNSAPTDDSVYLKQYDHASRDIKVIKNFETKYTLTATYLSPEFRTAFAQRYEALFSSPQPFLEEASSKAGFFISLFSPERDGYDLTDDRQWSIVLDTKDNKVKPILIKRLRDKPRWLPFFLGVHQWSSEYLVLFDTPSVSLNSSMVEKRTFDLHLANADAKVKLSW